MDKTAETTKEVEGSPESKEKPANKRPRKKMQRTRSFTDALREKYCSQDFDGQSSDFVINILIRHKPRGTGENSAELAHLRNVVLNNRRVSTGGVPPTGLAALCPNVTDLDLSSNLLESWAELLPILSQLPNLTFLNLSRNHLTRHKEELFRWGSSLLRLENVVLNSTGIPLREVLALARLMPALKELHICCNYYRDLGSIDLAIQEGALSKVECLRLNENIITSWAEVWKLRHLPCLTQLILSENPLCDVFYDPSYHLRDEIDGDSPNVTCHSDGEDSSYGSPCFKFSVPWAHNSSQSQKNPSADASQEAKLTTPSCTAWPQDQSVSTNNNSRSDSCVDNQAQPVTLSDVGHCTEKQQVKKGEQSGEREKDGVGKMEGASSDRTCSQTEVVSELLKDLVTGALERISVQESCAYCGEQEVQLVNPRSHNNADFTSSCPPYDSFVADFPQSTSPLDVSVDEQNFSSPATPSKAMTSTPVKMQTDRQVKSTVGRCLEPLLTGCKAKSDTTSAGDITDTSMITDDAEMSVDAGIGQDADDSSFMDQSSQEAVKGDVDQPFLLLHTLCLSRTSISDMDHLHTLNDFPQLRSLKIMDSGLFPDSTNEDRRKLLVASLPRVKILNGSEVTVTERDKAERHYLRYFMERDTRPPRYYELESKHGPMTPLLDIDLGKRFQKEATLTFLLNGEEVFTDTVSVLQPVGKLRSLVAHTLGIPRRSFRMYHYACGPDQMANEGAFDELCLESLPMSRFDFLDGDEIHIEFIEEPNTSAVVHFSKKEIKF